VTLRTVAARLASWQTTPMRTIPAFGLAAALALAGCGGQSNQAADAGADAYVGDVATDAPAVDVQSDSAPSNDASMGGDAALCGGCAPGLLCCNVLMGGTYQCIDPKTDPLDCGGCNTICSPGSQYCGNGTCAVPPCSSTCTSGLCCGDSCCAHGRICCMADGGLQCVGGITCP